MGDEAEMRGTPASGSSCGSSDQWMASRSAEIRILRDFSRTVKVGEEGRNYGVRRWILGSPAEEGRFGDGARCRVRDLRPYRVKGSASTTELTTRPQKQGGRKVRNALPGAQGFSGAPGAAWEWDIRTLWIPSAFVAPPSGGSAVSAGQGGDFPENGGGA